MCDSSSDDEYGTPESFKYEEEILCEGVELTNSEIEGDVALHAVLTPQEGLELTNSELEAALPAVSRQEENCGSVVKEEFEDASLKNLKNRWRNVSENEIIEVQLSTVAEKTKKQTGWGVKVFDEWMREAKQFGGIWENLSKEELNVYLREFYCSMRQKNGERYSKSAFVNVRSSLNRHLTLPPHSR